jgi:hypothetical protein
VIRRVIDAIADRDANQLVRVYAFQASEVKAKLVSLRATAVVRIDPTSRTEVVLRSVGFEAVDRQEILALDNTQAFERDGPHDRAFSPTHGAIAPPRIEHAVGQVRLQDDATTVARCPVLRLDDGTADFTDRW